MIARDIEQKAALWLIRSDEPEWSADDQAALDSWLDESMAHKAAYWRLEHGWREADRIAALGPTPANDSAARWALAGWRPGAAAAALAALLLFGAVQLSRTEPGPISDLRVDTPVGGHKIVPLVDGTKVELNTATAMRASVSRSRREVWLDRGEAYFEVAHLDGRPFVVHAGSRTITVLGTKFSVRRDGDKIAVSVVEGRVRIEDARQLDKDASAILTAGDVAVARGPSTLLAARSEARVESALAWRGGMLEFDGTPLDSAAAEFNRYNRRQIVISDSQTANIRIGGTFQASNVDTFARLLHDAYGLQIDSGPETIRISG